MKRLMLSYKEYGAATLIAFLLRLLLFIYYIFPNHYYHQPDSADYHYCALSISKDGTMSYPQLKEPIFWRTPGYPLFLTPFYALFNTSSYFEKASQTHWWILLVQIIICSFLPVLVAFFIQSLGGGVWAVRCGMWWAVGHLGSILASTFLLSDALGALIFVIYLLFFIASLRPSFSTGPYDYRQLLTKTALSALYLGIYTWIRPNGQFFGVVSLLLIAVSGLNFSKKIVQGLVFSLFLGIVLAPWLIRNYQLTSHVFFCPLGGAYLQTFCAPKIVSRLTGMPLVTCIQQGLNTCLQAWMHDRIEGQKETPVRYSSKELICAQQALRVIYAHPFFFIHDWFIECFKTTFDLYSYQLVAAHQGTYFYDPPVEFLSEKLYECLIGSTLWIALLGWIEVILTLLIWSLIAASLWIIVIRSHHKKENLFSWYWCISGFIVLSACGMTGGFGYARLRLCIEPLFWSIAAISFEKFLRHFRGI